LRCGEKTARRKRVCAKDDIEVFLRFASVPFVKLSGRERTLHIRALLLQYVIFISSSIHAPHPRLIFMELKMNRRNLTDNTKHLIPRLLLIHSRPTPLTRIVKFIIYRGNCTNKKIALNFMFCFVLCTSLPPPWGGGRDKFEYQTELHRFV